MTAVAAPGEKTVRFATGVMQTGFTMIPNLVLLDERLSPLAVRLYGLLAHYARQDEHCWPGQDVLVTQANASERSVRAALRQLEELSLLQTRRRGMGRTNVYILLDPKAKRPSSDRQILPVMTGNDCRSGSANTAAPDRQQVPVLKDEEDAVEEDATPSGTESAYADSVPREHAGRRASNGEGKASSIERARQLHDSLDDPRERAALTALVAVATVRGATVGWDPAASIDLVHNKFRNRDIAGEANRFAEYYSPGGRGENRPLGNLTARWREWLNRAPTLDTLVAHSTGNGRRGGRRAAANAPVIRHDAAAHSHWRRWAEEHLPDMPADLAADYVIAAGIKPPATPDPASVRAVLIRRFPHLADTERKAAA